MKKIENYLNYIFSDYESSNRIIEIKDELSINLNEKYNDYIKDGLNEKDSFDKAINSLGDIDELLESFNLVQSNSYYSEQLDDYIAEVIKNDDEYRSNYEKIAIKVGFGVLLIIHSFAVMSLVDEYNNSTFEVIGITYFFIMIAIAVALFIFAGFQTTKLNFEPNYNNDLIIEFEKDNKLIKAINKQKSHYNTFISRANIFLVSGIILCILAVGVSPLIDNFYPKFVGFYFFSVAAIGVFMIIYGGMLRTYSSALQSKKYISTQKKTDGIASVIMLLATIIFLISGFIFNAWHPMWIVFVIGGISVGIYESIISSKL